MNQKVEAQLHLWPWSCGIQDETENLTSGSVQFDYWGSAVVSISTRATLYLPQRHEKFVPFGPSFKTQGEEYQLYETPHGVLASSEGGGREANQSIRIRFGNHRSSIQLIAFGARTRLTPNVPGQGSVETELARTLLAWSQFFDDLIEDSQKRGSHEPTIPWKEIFQFITGISGGIGEPRMALIVKIAERMQRRLSRTVDAARRVLLRERIMLPANRIAETDSACLQWLVRQPGETIVEKAATQRQSLLGIARKESFQTLENRVLKSFLLRCSQESKRYLENEVNNVTHKSSKRAAQVRSFRNLCGNLGRNPIFEGLPPPPPGVMPNYVLQNDNRYREVWKNYVRLLRREDEEDRLWDWQSRTWTDVARFLVSAAIVSLTNIQATGLVVEEMLGSFIHLFREQRLGSRVKPGSEPGPFVFWKANRRRKDGAVLEVVHSDLAGQHPVTRDLGRTGGHLYLVLTPLGGRQRTIAIVWAAHTAGSERKPIWDDIGRSAKQALDRHAMFLGERVNDPPRLDGVVVASDLKAKGAGMHSGPPQGLHVVQVPTDQRFWRDAIAGLSAVLEEVLNRVVE